MKLLIVEDSKLIVARILDVVENIEGIETIGFTGNVKTAEEKILKEKPDIIILDIHLQDGVGLSLQYFIHSKKIKTSTIILTNYASPILKKKSFELGVKYFYDKSKDFGKLGDALNELVSQK